MNNYWNNKAKLISPIVSGHCGGFAKLFLTGLFSVIATSSSFAESEAAIDSQGKINVLLLQQAIVKVSALPTGDYDCYVENGEEEMPHFSTNKERIAYERQRAQEKQISERYVTECNSKSKREARDLDLARGELNRKWIPLLNEAVRRKDLVAEVILRVCETAPMLDRSGIASDCSERFEEREFARTRLEAINFKPALFLSIDNSDANTTRNCSSADYVAKKICQVEAQIERYKRMLVLMRSGYLGVAETWNSCQIKSDDKDVDRLAQECQRLFYLTRSAVGTASRSYVRSLSLAAPSEFPGGTDHINFGKLTRVDWSAFLDPDFQVKFDAEAAKIAMEIKLNIENDLRNDSRWGIFLIDRSGNRQCKDL